MTQVRTSLEVGFAEGALPACFAAWRGVERRALPARREFPYEDAQFEVVLLDASALDAKSVREAHRVLKPGGTLRFVVPERTSKQPGYTLPDIYSLVRDGFNITEVVRPHWWLFGRRGRTLTICAQKKKWKSLRNQYRPLV